MNQPPLRGTRIKQPSRSNRGGFGPSHDDSQHGALTGGHGGHSGHGGDDHSFPGNISGDHHSDIIQPTHGGGDSHGTHTRGTSRGSRGRGRGSRLRSGDSTGDTYGDMTHRRMPGDHDHDVIRHGTPGWNQFGLGQYEKDPKEPDIFGVSGGMGGQLTTAQQRQSRLQQKKSVKGSRSKDQHGESSDFVHEYRLRTGRR